MRILLAAELLIVIAPLYSVEEAVGREPLVVYLIEAVGDSVDNSSEKLEVNVPDSFENQTLPAIPAVFAANGVGESIVYQSSVLSG